MRSWLLRLLGGRWLERAEVVRIGPDDVVVLTIVEIVSLEQVNQMRLLAQHVFPGNRVLVLSGGTTLSVHGDGGAE